MREYMCFWRTLGKFGDYTPNQLTSGAGGITVMLRKHQHTTHKLWVLQIAGHKLSQHAQVQWQEHSGNPQNSQSAATVPHTNPVTGCINCKSPKLDCSTHNQELQPHCQTALKTYRHRFCRACLQP